MIRNLGIKFRLKHIGVAILILKTVLIIALIYQAYIKYDTIDFFEDDKFYLFIVVGFLAQLVDGTLGMAYGISCSTLLLNFGVPPRVTTAAVHIAEVFTTGVSGLSHLKFNNVQRGLFLRMVITGVVGAFLGAYLISDILDGEMIKPYMAMYVVFLGIIVLVKGIRNRENPNFKGAKKVELLAFVGSFLDSIGGGGWGPLVSSNLLSQGGNPQKIIGTVNTVEFFITFTSTCVFVFFVGVQSWPIVMGLIVGGVFAAPIGAFFVKYIKRRPLMIMVGTVVIISSLYTVINHFFF